MFFQHEKVRKNVKLSEIIVTFIEMMRKKNNKNNVIDANSIFEYFFDSWLNGFRILCVKINKD